MESTPTHPYTLRVLGFEEFGLVSQVFEAALQTVLRKANLKNSGVYQFKLIKEYSSHTGRMFEFRHAGNECVYVFRCYLGGLYGIPATHYGLLSIPPETFRSGIFNDLRRAAAEVLSLLPASEAKGEEAEVVSASGEIPPALPTTAGETVTLTVSNPVPKPTPRKEPPVKKSMKTKPAATPVKKSAYRLEEMLAQARRIEIELAKHVAEVRKMVEDIETILRRQR